MNAVDGDYQLLDRFPGIDDYRCLHAATGLVAPLMVVVIVVSLPA